MSAQQRLNSQISFQFYTGSRLMQRMYRPYLDEWGITYSQYLVLECLWEEDGQTIADLSIPLDLDSGTLSPLLKRMENGGFVRRQAEKPIIDAFSFSSPSGAKSCRTKPSSWSRKS